MTRHRSHIASEEGHQNGVMDTPSSIILSRMMTASRQVDVIANNIANATTPGFESSHLASAAWIDRMQGVSAPPGGDTLAYTASRGTWRNTRAGPIRETGNPLDLAITGQGYFTVQTPNGPRLTRDGRFQLLPNGTIADSAGHALLSTNGKPIALPTNGGTPTIAADGTISVRQPGGANSVIGQIGVVNVANQQNLAAVGGNLFAASTRPTKVTTPKIVQGALEGSNVQPVTEITAMMHASRMFEMLAQVETAEHSRSQATIQQLLGPTNS